MFTAGQMPGLGMVIAYFAMLFLTGLTESAREGLLTVFGQKITHAMRSRLMEKFTSLTADELNGLEPGSLVSRFIGDVDMIENLFTSGIISMFADACKIISILVVIWFKNKGLTLVFIILLPVFVYFYKTCAEKYACGPDYEQTCCKPCVRTCSADIKKYKNNSLLWQRKVYGKAV